MKVAFVLMFLAVTGLAHSQSAVPGAACGPEDVDFKVKLDNTHHALTQPDPGKAQVYFIQDKGAYSFGIGGSVQTKIGLDGRWVGANRNNSYFSLSLEPGEHHLCAEIQSSLYAQIPEFAHFTAEAGKVVYFRVRFIPSPYGPYLFLDLLDSDQGEYLTGAFSLSVSRATQIESRVRYSGHNEGR
jgi:hypothetical protein